MTQQKRTTAVLTKIPPSLAPAGSKVGMTALGDRAVPSAPKPQDTVSAGANRTQISTYLTTPQLTGSTVPVLYNGDRLWARVRLTLETAGPVVVGQSSQILPVLSGKGVLLPTGQEFDITIAKGTKLYIASTSVNRVKVIIEPLPWLEQMTAMLSKIAGVAADDTNVVQGAQRSKL